MKRGELVIHIGPPKTATTSLQYFFQELNHPEIVYAGIHQPRADKKDSIGKRIYQVITKDNSEKINEVIDSIKYNLEIGKSVFISEEMFLVESKGMSFNIKISNLFRIVNQLDPTVLLTFRNPEHVIPSYYTQVYHSLGKKSFKNFIHSPYCEIYKYQTLKKSLNQIGFRKIKWLHYEDLVRGDLYVSNIFGNVTVDKPIKLIKKNISKKQGKERMTKPVSFKKIILNKLYFLSKVPFFKNKILKNIYSLIPDYRLSEKKVDIHIESNELKSFIEEYEQTKIALW